MFCHTKESASKSKMHLDAFEPIFDAYQDVKQYVAIPLSNLTSLGQAVLRGHSLKVQSDEKLTGVLIYIQWYRFVCCIATDLFFNLKGQPPLSSITPFSAFNYNAN